MLDGLELAVGPALRLRRAARGRHQMSLFRLEEQLLLERATQPVWKSTMEIDAAIQESGRTRRKFDFRTEHNGIIPGMIQNFWK